MNSLEVPISMSLSDFTTKTIYGISIPAVYSTQLPPRGDAVSQLQNVYVKVR